MKPHHVPRTPRTIVAHVEDRPGVLARVVGLFRRRGYNIASLTVARTHDPGVSRLTVVIDADDETARRIEANLYKLIDVLYVDDVTATAAVIHELALIKVSADVQRRTDVIELCKVMQDVDGHLCDLEDLGFRNRFRPGPFIVVAAHGGQWRQAPQLIQHPGVADIARVNDEIAAAQKRQSLGS